MRNPRLPQSCEGCPLCSNPYSGKFTEVTGKGRLGVLVVAEASGKEEGMEGRPLIEWAASGSIFEKAIRSKNWRRDDFWITNCIRCRPPSNILVGAEYEQQAIDHCRPNLDAVIESRKPRAIVALGATPLRELTGFSGGKRSISYVRGFGLQSRYGIPVIGSLHPAFLSRGNTKYLSLLMHDIQQAILFADGRKQLVTDPSQHVRVRVGVEALRELYEEAKADPTLWIAYDIETDESLKGDESELTEFERASEEFEDNGGYLEEGGSDEPSSEFGESTNDEGRGTDSSALDVSRARINSIQFALYSDEGVFADWGDREVRQLARLILGLSNPKVGFNSWLFDDPILKREGINIVGPAHDCRWMFKSLQPDLPAHLQGVAGLYGWCLAASQKVPLWDGSVKKIKEIVDNKLEVTLVGLDEQGKRIPVKVIDWHKNRIERQDWVRIRVDGAKMPIYCTPDHKVWRWHPGHYCYVWERADQLKPGMQIPLPSDGWDDLIHGCLLGDGHVNKTNQLHIVHSVKQEAYAKAKADALGMFNLREKKNNNHTNVVAQCLIDSRWRKTFYPEGSRVFIEPPSLEALAIWYMDDGHWKKFNNRKSGDGTASIAIHASYNEVEVKDFFEKWFGSNLTLSKNRNSWQLYIKTKSRDSFYSVIAEYIHPSMYYKLPPKYRGRYNGWLERGRKVKTGTVKSVETGFRSPGVLKELNTRYCVTVDHPTHRFFTLGGLVSNCFPWKHLAGINPELYGVIDVCSLIQIVSILANELYRFGMWEAYDRFYRLRREQVLAPVEIRGLPMSVERLDEYREWLTKDIEEKREKMTEYVPLNLHQRDPEGGYKNLPPFIKDFVYDRHPELFTPTTKTYKNGKTKEVKSKTKPSDVYELLVTDMLTVHNLEVTSSTLFEVQMKYGLELGEFGNGELRLYKHVPFNPSSSKQMIEYIKSKGYPVPLSFKEKKETTGDKALRQLAKQTGDPLIPLAQEIRAEEKLQNTYTGKVGKDGVARGGWIPQSDGRLRTRFTYTATWQLGALRPNILTMPKRRGELANRFRRCLVAEPGHVIVAFDYTAFHDLMTAVEASDPIKYRMAKLDPHSYVAGWLVKYPGIERAMEMEDAELIAFLKEIRAKHENVREYQAKPLNHGTNFGQGYRRLYKENEDYFKDEAEAKRLLQQLRKIFPATFAWQDEILKSLDPDEGGRPYLQSKWGGRRWFWHVWKWDKNKDGKWYKSKGPDAEKAMAYYPAHHSHGMLADKTLYMAEWGWLDKYQLINLPHDELLFHCPAIYLDECLSNVKNWMEAPVKQLAHPILCPTGFSCGVESSFGPDRGTMQKVK